MLCMFVNINPILFFYQFVKYNVYIYIYIYVCVRIFSHIDHNIFI